MSSIFEALTQLSDKLDRACVERVLTGLETIGAFQIVSYLREMLLHPSVVIHPSLLAQQRALALACQELCWEKIHTGNWNEVLIS